jgi:hypothetical protein
MENNMQTIRKLFRESFGDNRQCVLEFTYSITSPLEVENVENKFKELLQQLDIKYVTPYRNINKITVVCDSSKINDVKSIAKSLNLTIKNELIPDSDETIHL